MDKEKKRIARYLCLQAIYAYEISGNQALNIFKTLKNNNDPILMKHFNQDLVDLFGDLTDEQFLYSKKLYDISIINKENIDTIIKDNLNNWDISRLSTIDKLILRMSISEMFFIDDIPPKVSITEGVEIAKVFSTNDSSSFVNGILDVVYNELYMKQTNKS